MIRWAFRAVNGRRRVLRAVWVSAEGARSCLAEEVAPADGFWQRLRGRMGRPPFRPGEGLLLRPCWAVHTWFCRGCMDLLFLGRDGRVAAVVRQLQPWRFAACPGATAVLELPAGACHGVRVGDRVVFQDGRMTPFEGA